jgi:hypothetical protein
LAYDRSARPAAIEAQLIEFALSTKKNELIHGDLRPWNVFCDNEQKVQVIDWWYLSSFVSDLVGEHPRRLDLTREGPDPHYARFHSNLVSVGRFTEIDLTDAKTIGRLLRSEINFSDTEAWGGSYRSMGKFLWE